MYFRQRIGDMTAGVTKLLHLDRFNQYRTTNGWFKWKLNETKLKIDKDKGKLGEERYQTIAFAIFGLVLFLSEAAGIISVKAANVFAEYERIRSNPSSVVVTETFLSLNHYRMHGKGAMRCCISLLFTWIVSHLKTPREVFNNFL